MRCSEWLISSNFAMKGSWWLAPETAVKEKIKPKI